MNATYRYPGVKPFEASDTALFFGRDRDRTDLFDLVHREQLTVLFGKSGYGKSSLLKAGLIPKLIENPRILMDPASGEERKIPNLPIHIRLNLCGKYDKAVMPIDTVLHRFNEFSVPADKDPSLQEIFAKAGLGKTLWSAFKCSKLASEQRIFLIFDQFEEFFSYPPAFQKEFRQQISELLYTRIPQSVRNNMEDLDAEHKRRIFQALDVHVLFAIRSDRIHLLNGMRDDLPAILQSRYELKALSEQQAEEAIRKPAQLISGSFLLQKPFDYEPAALKKIISELNKAPEKDMEIEPQSHIEAFQLQMVCQTLEQKLIAQTKKSRGQQPLLVRESDLPDFKQIFEQYYADRLADLPDQTTRDTAHVLLEEVMVIGEDMSNIRRISVDKDLLIETMQQNHKLTVTQELLDYLEDRFLIRRETIGGRIHYEVSHDGLLTPLLKAREAARAKTQQIAAEKRALEAEAEAQREREARVHADKRRRRAKLLALASVAGFFCAAIVGFWALDQKELAQLALSKLKTAEEQRVQAEMEKKKGEFYQTIADIEIILKSPDGCPDKGQMIQLDTTPQHYIQDTILQKRVNDVKEKIRTNQCF